MQELRRSFSSAISAPIVPRRRGRTRMSSELLDRGDVGPSNLNVNERSSRGGDRGDWADFEARWGAAKPLETVAH
jgi:hypothetical protein